jgi:hypothetical protein
MITSLPVAFDVAKAMQADGLDWKEVFRPLGRQAVAEIIAQQMAKAIDVYLDLRGCAVRAAPGFRSAHSGLRLLLESSQSKMTPSGH